MRTAFFRYALLAGLLTASLGAGAPAASGSPTGGATAGGAAASGSTAGAPAASSSTSGTPAASGSTSGGAAPTPTSTSRFTLATWFGPGFYGHATACGQTMSPTLVGVASRTLPCGTLVQVGYRGHLLTVPVLDRGPYGHNGATWDLTRGAAQALEIKETVRVSTQIVGHVANTPTLGEPELSAAGTPSAPLTPAPAGATGGATAG